MGKDKRSNPGHPILKKVIALFEEWGSAGCGGVKCSRNDVGEGAGMFVSLVRKAHHAEHEGDSRWQNGSTLSEGDKVDRVLTTD